MRYGVRRVAAAVLAFVAGSCHTDSDTDESLPLAKVSPAKLSVVGAWGLFDRSIESGFVAGTEPIRVTFDGPEQLSSLKVYGSAPYRLRVTGMAGTSIGFPTIDLSTQGPGWHAFHTTALIATNLVELHFEATSKPEKIPEIEFWSVADATTSGEPEKLDLTSTNLPTHFVTFQPGTRSAEIPPAECATFDFNVLRSPAEFERAFLVYDAEGLFRSFSLRRTVNGVAEYGGRWLAGTADARGFADEVEPTSLHLGTNEVSLCVPADATRGVALSNVRLVGELDIGRGLATAVSMGEQLQDGASLVDRDADTTLTVEKGHRVLVSFERLIAPDVLLLDGQSVVPSDVAGVECVARDGNAQPMKLQAEARPSGIAVLVDGGAQACAQLAFTLAETRVLGEVDVVGSGAAEAVDWPRMVVTSAPEHFGDQAWVSGFVVRPPSMAGAIRVSVAGLQVDAMTGEFGELLHRSEALADAWPVTVTAKLPSGAIERRQLVLDRDLRTQLVDAKVASAATSNVGSVDTAFGVAGNVVTGRAKKLEPTRIRLGSRVGVSVPAGAVDHPTDITLKHLADDALPPLDPGMFNVTAPKGRGYEFLPHGQHFKKAVDIVLPYDQTLIPEGMTPDDVHAYFYDPQAQHWKRLDRTAIDVGERVTHSASTHFTIMINAVLTVPKNSAPLSFDPTALTSIAAASPATNIDLIEPPSANSDGDARLAMPVRVPQGRGAYSPSLSISYASSGGNGWLGLGWNVALSRIEIDTRWGVPSYDSSENHRYLLDGAELVRTMETEGPQCTSGSFAGRYHTRIEGAFAHILRCGSGPTSYHWEVHDTNGTLFVYGDDDATNPDDWETAPDHASLGSYAAPKGIFRWNLHRVVDVHGNATAFRYQVDKTAPGSEPSRETYPWQILYTSNAGKPSAYSIEFVLDAPSRPDVQMSGRPGFKTVTRHLLRTIRVKFGSEVIRDYVLTYGHGQFEKTVLARVAVYGVGGCPTPGGNAFQAPGCNGAAFFYQHSFDYYVEGEGFDAPTSWNVEGPHADLEALNQSKTTAYSGSIGLGTTEDNIGANASRNARDEQVGLYDVNSDGLPDELFDDGTVLYNQSRPGRAPADGPLFSPDGPAITHGFPAMPREITWSAGVSASASLDLDAVAGSISAGFDSSSTKASRILTDVNGDNFIDVVYAADDGRHDKGTADLGYPCGDEMCFSTVPIAQVNPFDDPSLVQMGNDVMARLFVADPVVQWVAPFDGDVEISGTAEKAAAGGTDGVMLELLHQDTALEATSIAADDTSVVAFPAQPTTIHVAAGEAIYMRVATGADEGVTHDGQFADRVDTDLHVRYTSLCSGGFCVAVPDVAAHDPTGRPLIDFSSRDDFRLVGPAPFFVPANGVIDIHAMLLKSPTIADLRVCLQRFPAASASNFIPSLDVGCDDANNAVENVSGTTTFAAGSVTSQLVDMAFPVEAGQLILLRVESDLTFDPANVVLEPASEDTPLFTYLSVCNVKEDASGYECTQDQDALDAVRITTTTFGPSVFEPDAVPRLPFVAPTTGFLTVAPPLPTTTTQSFIYAIRSDLQGIIALHDCRNASCSLTSEVFQVRSGESITFELVSEDGTLGPSDLDAYYDPAEVLSAPLVRRPFRPEPTAQTPFAGGYRRWRAAMWNENQPFTPAALVEDYADLEDQTIERQREIALSVIAGRPAFQSVFAGAPAWIAPTSTSFVSGGSLHAGHVGLVATDDRSEAYAGGLLAGDYARQSLTTSGYLGAEAHLEKFEYLSLDLQCSKSTTKSTADLVDLDGDGVADLIGGEQSFAGAILTGAIQSLPIPGLSFGPSGFRRREGHEYSIGFRAHAVKRRTNAHGRDKNLDSDTEPHGGFLGLFGGTGYGIARTATEMDLEDINGDGLPDQVFRHGSTITVRLNLGSRFGAEEPFGTVDPALDVDIDGFQSAIEAVDHIPLVSLDSTSNAIAHDTTITKHASAGLHLKVLDLGASKVSVSTRTTRQLADINGDGMPDLLLKRDSDPYIRVQYNLGRSFGPPTQWTTDEWRDENGNLELSPGLDEKIIPLGLTGPDVLALTTTASSGYSASGSLFGVTAGGSRTTGIDRYELGLVDIDGDGTADHVLRKDVGGAPTQIYVKHNRLEGKANLLQRVHESLGGTITLDYARTANTVAMPSSRQVLVEVHVDDHGDLGPGFESPPVITHYAYNDGFYSRNEKEFFGFVEVTTTRSDGVTTLEAYDNQSYTLHGSLLRQTRKDSQNRIRFDRELTYDIRGVVDEDGQPIAIDPDCLSHLPLLLSAQPDACVPQFAVVTRETELHSENGTLAKTHVTHDDEFDRFGRVLVSTDEADDAIATDDVFARVTYRNDTSRWILGHPQTLQARAGTASGQLLRSRSATYTSLGDLETLSVDTGSGIATTTLQYDVYGNLEKITTPPNAKGQRQTHAMQYDGVTATYPVQLVDGFGYTSSATYDLRFGIATSEVDVNGQQLHRTLDEFGRLANVYGPYDSASEPALATSYYVNEPRPRAVTTTRPSTPPGFASLAPPQMKTVTVVDGLGGVIELRKTSVVDGATGMTTSGLVQRDSLGRVIGTYQPFFTAGPSEAFEPPQATGKTRTDYDELDRVVKTTFPDDQFASTTFEIATAPGGTLLMLARAIDPNGHARETYSDLASRTRAFVEHPSVSDASVTAYDYFPTGELSRIVDAEGNVSTLAYDLRGLRTALDNPDTGLVEDRFDLMGNLVATIEPNHRALGVEITQEFELDRLVKIDYPSKPDVTYEYGDVGASDGRVGRLVRISDESGSQEYFYGALGEIRRTVRTVEPDEQGSQSVAFDTRFVTDSLGRMLRITYPDNVEVTNTYDAGGMLTGVAGRGDGWTRIYASDIRYDVFGNRTQLTYGNGVVTSWHYDPNRVRLDHLTTTLPGSGGATIQDLHYVYDPASNPTKIENTLSALGGGSGNLPGRSTLTLTYDGVDRLTHAVGDAQLSAQKQTRYDEVFAYTASHNIRHKARAHFITQPGDQDAAPNKTNFVSDYIYDAGRPHLPSQVGDLVVTYDPSGNPTQRRTVNNNRVENLVWDDDNRLVDFTSGGVHQHNTYDASGNRVRRKSTQSETLFASQYFDLENGTQGARHIFAGDVRVASEMSKFTSGTTTAPAKPGTVYFFHQDHVGSTSVLTSADASVYESLEYFVDGEQWIDRGPQKPVHRYLFSGKPFDPDTGFYDFGQRFYDPRTSLWLGVDPAFGDSPKDSTTRPSRLALLTFSFNNPARFFDPDGRAPCDGLPYGIGGTTCANAIGQSKQHLPLNIHPRAFVESQGTRIRGGLKMIGGYAGATVGAFLCAIPGGCAVGGPIIGLSADVTASGVTEFVTNEPAPTVVGTFAGPKYQQLEEDFVGAAGMASVFVPHAPAPIRRPPPAEPAAPAQNVEFIDPANLRPTQELGQMNRSQITRMAKDMKKNGTASYPPIDVVEHEGTQYIAGGHHRACAACAAKQPIPARVSTAINPPDGKPWSISWLAAKIARYLR